MSLTVTLMAKGNQILLFVVSQATPEFFVMNLQVHSRPTYLAPPIIAVQNLLT
jgi:hypothetical protein